MSAALDLAVDAAAAYRLTKLVTDDVLTEDVRRAVVVSAFVHERRRLRQLGMVTEADEYELDHDDATPIVESLKEWEATADVPAPKLATLVTCRWCAGVWVALGVVAASRVAPRAWRPLGRALALSAAAALTAGLER